MCSRYIEAIRMRVQYVAGRSELYQHVQRLSEAQYVSMNLQRDLEEHHLGLRTMGICNIRMYQVNGGCHGGTYFVQAASHGTA